MRLLRTKLSGRRVVSVVLLVGWALAGCGPPSADTGSGTEVDAQSTIESQHHRSHHSSRRNDLEVSKEPRNSEGPDKETRPKSGGRAATAVPAAAVPDKVAQVLRFIDENRHAPDGYEGGRSFHNAGNVLPRIDASGHVITYQEWDVNRKTPGVNRGAERLVTGSDGSAYYTADHYRTFTKIR
jgi:ribonuclease T1